MRFLTLFVLLLAGCSADSVAKASSDNKDVSAEIIANVDGCAIYRVHDGSDQRIYFVRCPNGSTQTSWGQTRVAGKIVVIDHYKIDTVEGR